MDVCEQEKEGSLKRAALCALKREEIQRARDAWPINVRVSKWQNCPMRSPDYDDVITCSFISFVTGLSYLLWKTSCATLTK